MCVVPCACGPGAWDVVRRRGHLSPSLAALDAGRAAQATALRVCCLVASQLSTLCLCVCCRRLSGHKPFPFFFLPTRRPRYAIHLLQGPVGLELWPAFSLNSAICLSWTLVRAPCGLEVPTDSAHTHLLCDTLLPVPQPLLPILALVCGTKLAQWPMVVLHAHSSCSMPFRPRALVQAVGPQLWRPRPLCQERRRNSSSWLLAACIQRLELGCRSWYCFCLQFSSVPKAVFVGVGVGVGVSMCTTVPSKQGHKLTLRSRSGIESASRELE